MNNNPEEKKETAEKSAENESTMVIPSLAEEISDNSDAVKSEDVTEDASEDAEADGAEDVSDNVEDDSEADGVDTEDTTEEELSGKPAGNSGKNVKNKRKSAKKRRTMKLSAALIMTTLIFGISITLAVFILMLGKDFVGLGKSDAMTVFTVEQGDTTADIAQALYEQDIIEVPMLFRLISKLSGKDGLFQVGEHYLRPSMAYEAILEELTSGTIDSAEEKETVSVMFQEGITLYAAAERLENFGVCSAEDFLYEFNAKTFDYEFDRMINSANMKFYKKEGFLFPDTYTFYVNSDPEVVCTTIAHNFNSKFKPEYFARMGELGMTLDEVITLASIIQAEVGDPLEMKKVSAVFHNRLDNPVAFPLLQSDATTNYVNNIIKEYAAFLSQDMCNAYDTYIGSGLPPGAINNPGLDAIIAALYPDDTDYYFFCSDSEGTYYYAKTNAEHEANYAIALEVGGYDKENADEGGDGNH